MAEAYDPLNYENLARSVVTALLEHEPQSLPPSSSFAGAGVYAVYYCGNLDFYSAISSKNCRIPVYVGKALRQGARKGAISRGPSIEAKLYHRLVEHGKSVEQAANLRVSDFKCRYLVVVPVWISLAERFLIEHFRPLWNVVIDGFGNHAPGAGRKDMRRPRWDIVHPGRKWAERLSPAESFEEVVALIQAATVRPMEIGVRRQSRTDGSAS